jgi:hypothetical protein
VNFINASNMLVRLNKTLDRPTQVPSPAAVVALLRDYVLPILQEVVARSEETSQAVLSTNALAQSAFVTARQTLAGDLMSQISEAAMQLREVLATALPVEHAAFDLLDQIDANLGTFEEYLLEDEVDDEGEEGDLEGGAPEAGDDDGVVVQDGPESPPEQIPVIAAQDVKQVIDVPAVVTTEPTP